MRNTRQRSVLTGLVASRQHPFTAEELWGTAREGGSPVGLATV